MAQNGHALIERDEERRRRVDDLVDRIAKLREKLEAKIEEDDTRRPLDADCEENARSALRAAGASVLLSGFALVVAVGACGLAIR